MNKMTFQDLKSLAWGDTVYRFSGRDFRKLRFVGFMPGSSNYLIFCDGEYLAHLYINEKDNSFNYDWFNGEYNSAFVGNLKIAKLQEDIESIKTIYIDE